MSISDGAPPILVAERGDEAAREMLRAVARGGGVLVVQLIAAPLALGPHVLEVRTPGGALERFFAEPVAAPCDLGFPLRLAPYTESDPHLPQRISLSAVLPAVGKALRDGDAATLSAVITTMRSIVRDDPLARRAKQAGRVLRFMREASRLVAFVDAALGESGLTRLQFGFRKA